jgi:hypothetical protein
MSIGKPFLFTRTSFIYYVSVSILLHANFLLELRAEGIEYLQE